MNEGQLAQLMIEKKDGAQWDNTYKNVVTGGDSKSTTSLLSVAS
jgi:hypothetical protein